MNLLRKTSVEFSLIALAAMLIMAITHAIGIIGLNSHKYHVLFENIASINLVLSFLLVITFHKPVNRNLFLFYALSFSIGMLAEVCGVNTGYPFGLYYYTSTFGWQVYGVPFIIGINWILLSYIAGVASNMLLWAEWQKTLAASVLMVVIDLLLENFATRHHFWVWHDKIPPLQNYISWFVISLLIQFGFRRLLPASVNWNAIAYLVILFLFLISDLVLAIYN